MNNLKRFLLILLVAVFSFSGSFTSVFAYTIEITPDDGDETDDTDTSDEDDGDSQNEEDNTDVSSESGTTAFEGLSYFVDVEKREAVLTGVASGEVSELNIPNSITYGGKTYPVTGIEEYAFYNSSLTEVTLGANVKKIKEGAFAFSSKLKKVTANAGLSFIGTGAFMYCGKLKNFQGSADTVLYTIGSGAFGGTALTSFSLPDSTDSIGSAAFAGCEALEKIYIGSGCGSIGSGAFAGCNSLGNIIVSKDNRFLKTENGCVYSIDGRILVFAAGASGELTVAEGTEIIAECAFEDNANVTSVVLPDSVREICANAFLNATSLEKVTGAGIEAIREDAFSGCTSLKEFTIPATTAVIEGNPFKYCTALTGFAVNKKNTSFKIVRGILSTYDRKKIISVPAAAGEIILSSKTRTIGSYAFCGNTALTGITFNKKLSTVLTGAFYDCTSLIKVALQARSVDFTAPVSVAVDGEYYYCRIFENCPDTLTVSVPNASDAGKEGSIEYHIRNHCSNGVTIINN